MSPLALALATHVAAPPADPPPPPPPGADEEVVVVDDEASNGEVSEPPAGEASDGAAPAEATVAEPSRAATEGSSKPPPPKEALKRESPLSQPDTQPRDRAGRPGSPQRFAFEFKMGPFLPDVDRTYQGDGFGPYATIFGQTNDQGATIDEPRAFPMPVLGFEWQFFYLGGPLGIGTQIGFFRDRASALVTEPMDGQSLRSEADDTAFGLIPVSLLLVYRFELPADRWRVPLVPYAKAGLAYSFFWNTSGSGNLARDSAQDVGRGGIPGWQLNLGGMFRLDALEPGTAKRLDQTTGINHTYLFGEYQIGRINNFGVGRTISLGDNTWFAGLAIEF